MTRNRTFRIVKFLAFGVVAVVVFGFVVTALWNWLMPDLFGLKRIGFWQAWGLIVLGKILFGGLHGGSNRGAYRRRMMQRWARMTPEERERFREAMRARHGYAEPPPKPST